MSLFAELKRRNVYRAAVFYAAAGWLLVQVATQVFPVFEFPVWAMRLVVVAVMVGFPFALIFSWFYKWTPEGLKLESQDDRSESITRATGKRLDRWIIATLGLVVVLLLADKLVPRRAGSTAADRSIAVLPFENLSRDPENAYFAEGIHDEILTRLAKIGALKVISRTSTQHYASSPDNLPAIARQLNVANVLEGSVQKAANVVHINVQLIRAATDDHLWAESYDRKLDDIFGVEGEVAGMIAEQLNARLSGTEKQALADKPTSNAQAYDFYLRGIVSSSRGDAAVPNTLGAIAEFEKAVHLDPAFAAAWGALSRAHAFAFFRFDPSAAHKERALHAMEMATRLAPDAEETLLAQGFYRYHVERQYDSASEIFARIHARWPNDANSVFALAVIARRQGRWNESLDLANRAIALDPRNTLTIGDAANTPMAMREWSVWRRLNEQAQDISPNNSGLLLQQAVVLQATGQIEEAQKILERMEIAPGNDVAVTTFAYNAILRRNYAPAIALLKSQLARPETTGPVVGTFLTTLGDLQRLSGDSEGAQRSYEQARDSLRKGVEAEPNAADSWSFLAVAEAGLGNRAEALGDAQKAITLMPSSRDALIGPAFEDTLARLQARFGDKDAAIAGLQRLLSIPYINPITPSLLRLDPDFDSLRDDPRFQELATRHD